MSNSIFVPGDILIPATDFEKWAVIACDQFSSEREYWTGVKENVGSDPSSYNLIVPEAYLKEVDMDAESEKCCQTMDQYLDSGVFTQIPSSYIYVERTLTDGSIRKGLVGALDLEKYDYAPNSDAPVRASEKTVAERLPARISVRSRASLELPHIIMFIDDAGSTVIEQIEKKKNELEKLYDFDLMEGGGHIVGYRVSGADAESILESLSAFSDRPIQMVIGDGNHSLAAAKEWWNQLKKDIPPEKRGDHPARYALVELNNVYDSGIAFEPIHRVVFGVDPVKLLSFLKSEFGDTGNFPIKYHFGNESGSISVPCSSFGSMIDTLQKLLEKYIAENGGNIDYIHDDDTALKMGTAGDNIAFILPPMEKGDLFKTVLQNGVFPKKSFSVGHARDKRYYLEARKIK